MLKDLCTYYDCLCQRKNSPLTPKGFGKVGITFNLQLTTDGTLKAILPHTQTVTVGKKEVERPREEIFPFRNSSTSIAAETIDHREKYLFGIDWHKDDKKLICTPKSLQAFEKCKEKNLAFLEGMTAPIVVAYRKFLESWNPQEELENFHLLDMGKAYPGSKFIISLDFTKEGLHETSEVIEKWTQSLATQEVPKDCIMGQCALSGEVAPLARLHTQINGLKGMSQSTPLVCFNKPAYESYGKEQSYNSSISQSMMEKYTEALKFLIDSPKHKQELDGTTFLFWAMTTDDEIPLIQGIRNKIFSSEDPKTIKTKSTEKDIASTLQSLSQGIVNDHELILQRGGVEFYILGIRPTSKRLAIKLFYHNTFGAIMKYGETHQKDMQLHPDDKPLQMWQIQNALKSPKSNSDFPPDFGMKLLESILNGTPYPRYILYTAIYRAKTDTDNKQENFYAINSNRVRIIKGCLLRLGILEREEFFMSTEPTQNPARLCGELFAVLEYIQRRASDSELNATIKDKFFSSACTTPHLVFPRLIKLAQHHLNKIGGNSETYFDKTLQEIISKLGESFPRTLSLENQGLFILGYYQRKEKLFTKKEED